MSAYACEPGKGSEPGVGWTVAREMARHHDIWVITRANNRPVIEAELARKPQPGLHFVYWDTAALGALLEARQTWGASLLLPLAAAHPRHRPRPRCRSEVRPHSSRDLRAVLGPKLPVLPGCTVRLGPGRRWRVGAAELLEEWRVVERACTRARESSRVGSGERGPFVRATARRSAVALGTTDETAARLRTLGSKRVETFSRVGLLDDECRAARRQPGQAERRSSVRQRRRTCPLKGCDISLRAFAQANIADAEYWLIGDGRDRRRLEHLASTLGIAPTGCGSCGRVPRHEVLSRLANCDVVLHPALHDSGGCAAVEAWPPACR